jgi:hypothetical protein
VLNWLILLALAIAAGSLLVGFRPSRGARQQLKWLAYGAVPALLVWIVPLPTGLGPWRTPPPTC